MRVIICGDRNWKDPEPIDEILYGLECIRERGGESVVIVHGACPTGADAIADHTAKRLYFPIESRPADWGRHGKAAGPIRNARMAELGADICWAFKNNFNWDLDRGGTENMVKLAKAAGIPTYVVSRA